MNRVWTGLIAGGILAAAAWAEPHGPVFGNNGYRSEIRDEGAPDTDDFVGPLAAGETLSVEVRVPSESGLLPALALFDPTGADRTPPVKSTRDGRVVCFRRFTADRTGRWVVRVLGREDTEGAYEVRFRVRPPRGPRTRTMLLGGAAPRVEVIPVEAIRGSRLDLRFRGGPARGAPPYLEVIDPAGRTVPGVESLLDREGRSLVLRDLPLDGPDGTWRILAGVDGGPEVRASSLSWSVASPRRPSGIADLDPAEPGIVLRERPLEASVGSVVRIAGRGFSGAPAPRVLLGGEPLAVLGVGAGGGYLDVRLPMWGPEEPQEVAVVNPDGQAAAAPSYLRVLPPGPTVVRSIEPVPVRTTTGSTCFVTVSLSGHAPPGGAVIALSVEGCAATVPATITVPPYGLEASFELLAGKVPGQGRLTAAWGRTVEAPVEILGIPGVETQEIDLSGWKVVQTSSARTLALPPGTRLRRGGTILLVRNATKDLFEKFWKVTLGEKVLYFDTKDTFPSLNGDETFTLIGPSGAVIDGPTPKLVAGQNLQRRGGGPAGDPASWKILVAVPGDATPGTYGVGVGDGAVRITEIADPAGSGQFIYEFVEIAWDAP